MTKSKAEQAARAELKTDIKVHEAVGKNENGQQIRINHLGYVLCNAFSKSAQGLCTKPVMLGMRVCRTHGGAAPKSKRAARLRLTELVDPAISRLADEMDNAKNSKDRIAAANSLLDRAGFGRISTTKFEGSNARALLVDRLKALQSSTHTVQQVDDSKALESPSEPVSNDSEVIDVEIVEDSE